MRAIELGISINDLDLLDIGFVMDMISEKMNDECDYENEATQEDYDNF